MNSLSKIQLGLNERGDSRPNLNGSNRTLTDQVSPHQGRSTKPSTVVPNKQDWLQTNKTSINKWTNYSAAIASGISFAVANTTDSWILNKATEVTSFGLTKISSLASGTINADSAAKASNPSLCVPRN